MSKQIPITTEHWKVLQELAEEQINEWKQRANFKVTVSGPNLQIHLQGPSADIEIVADDITNVLANIADKEVIATNTGAVSALESSTGQAFLNRLKIENRVNVQYNIEQNASYTAVHPNVEEFKPSSRIKIITRQDKLSHIRADVLICPTGPNLQLTGPVGEDVSSAGGKEIHEELNLLTIGSRAHGEICKSKPGNLRNYLSVFHAVCLNCKDSARISIVETLITKCLEMSDGLNYTKLALPVDFNCSGAEFADILWRQLSVGLTGVREVNVADMDAAKLYEFIVELRKKSAQNSSVSSQAASSTTTDGSKRPFLYDELTKSLSTEEGMKIEILEGNIVDVLPNVDVIVNSASSNMNLNQAQGTVSQTIYQHAGNHIQEELSKAMATLNLKTADRILQTRSHNIQHAKHVFHVSLVAYDGDPKGNSVKILRKTIYDVLENAKKENFDSIGIPALGSGVLKIPMNIVVDAMFEEINSFSFQNPGCCVKRFVPVAYNKNPSAVTTFSDTRRKIIAKARRVELWTQTFQPHSYRLQISIHSLDRNLLPPARNEFVDWLKGVEKERKITDESKLCRITNDKAKALESLQFMHKVQIVLNSASTDNVLKLSSIVIKGFQDDIVKAEADALKILSI